MLPELEHGGPRVGVSDSEQKRVTVGVGDPGVGAAVAEQHAPCRGNLGFIGCDNLGVLGYRGAKALGFRVWASSSALRRISDAQWQPIVSRCLVSCDINYFFGEWFRKLHSYKAMPRS